MKIYKFRFIWEIFIFLILVIKIENDDDDKIWCNFEEVVWVYFLLVRRCFGRIRSRRMVWSDLNFRELFLLIGVVDDE